MEKKKTYYHLVLDRSGSMADCWEEAKRLFTEQLQKIREPWHNLTQQP